MSRPAVYPVTITRTGGIAGFLDVVVVTADGLASVERKGQQPWRCRLTPETVERVRTAAATVPWHKMAADGGRPAFPDDLVTMVASPAGGPVRLPDPELGAVGQIFHELLVDLHGGPARSRLSTPI